MVDVKADNHLSLSSNQDDVIEFRTKSVRETCRKGYLGSLNTVLVQATSVLA